MATSPYAVIVQWVPHGWSEAPHREELEAYADRIVAIYDDRAPNFRRSVIARQGLGPGEMEQELGMIGGNAIANESVWSRKPLIQIDRDFELRTQQRFARVKATRTGPDDRHAQRVAAITR